MKLLMTGLLLLAMGAAAQTSIPAGTIIPARFNTSFNSQKSKGGQTITARVMQDVPLPSKKVIRAGTTLVGEITEISAASHGSPAEITLRFDKMKLAGQMVPVNTSLRALASMLEVEQAQIPPTGADRGTPWAWSTRDLIGGEVAYGEGGPVARGTKIVGHALAEGVLVPVRGTGSCADDGSQPQALWVFSSDACGVYGIDGVRVAHAGRTQPEGQITLTGTQNFEVRSGSGMLLRVNGSGR
jgi:hypothetical protein